MDQKTLQQKLVAGESVYLLDDFEEAAVHLMYEEDTTKAFIKHKGHK